MPTGRPDHFAIELMGAYIHWSDFSDYAISTDVDPNTVDLDDESAREATAATVSQNRLWARDAQNTFWVGLDVKRRIANDNLLLGGRVIYDRAAIPDTALAANNIDADTVILGGLGAINLTRGLDLGISYSHYFIAKRTTTTSAFATTLDAENATEDRYFYPTANGTYQVGISRLAVNLTGHFGKRLSPDSAPTISTEAATADDAVPTTPQQNSAADEQRPTSSPEPDAANDTPSLDDESPHDSTSDSDTPPQQESESSPAAEPSSEPDLAPDAAEHPDNMAPEEHE